MSRYVSSLVVALAVVSFAVCRAQEVVALEVEPEPANSGAAEADQKTLQDVAYPTKPGSYSVGEWQYTFEVLAPGTRSETVIGTLLYKGAPVIGYRGEVKDTPLGKFMYCGAFRGKPTYNRGWLNTVTYGGRVFGENGQVPKQAPDGMDSLWRVLVKSGNNAFALDLYGKLSEQEGNLFFSPYSISTALAMTYAGARGNTAAQMAEVMHFNLPQEWLHPAFGTLILYLQVRQQQEGGYELAVANALWGQKGYPWLNEFLELTRENYGAGLRLQEVDFAGDTEGARQTINDWVEEETREKILELLQEGDINVETALVLTNAIYFKGDWASRFKENRTRPGPFTLSDGSKVEVPMMHQTEEFGYMETDGLQALELPYAGEELSMLVLLPREIEGLAELEESLTVVKLDEWLGALREREVDVYLPRFKMVSRFELSEVLKALGMTDAFDPQNADFTGMMAPRDIEGPLWISMVIHKAFVDVNEEGTEAAAATAVIMQGLDGPEEPAIFRADHPFLFLIRDNASGSILFMGRVIDPVQG